MERITGIVLVGGEGKRLRPLTSGIPKPLLPIDGVPVIDYVVDNLLTCHSLVKIYMGVSYKAYTIKDYLSDRFKESKVPMEAIATLGLETAGDLKTILVSEEIESPIVVAYGDNLTQINIADMLAFHKKSGAQATLALFSVPWKDTGRFGIAEVNEGIITDFVEKPSHRPKTNLANAGYYIIEPSAFEKIPMKRARIENTLFPALIKERMLAGYIFKPKYWFDIGTLEAYKEANKRKVLEGVIPPDKIYTL